MIVIGVMGGGQADEKSLAIARQLGRLIAQKGWVLLNGGRNAGIMEASAQGAKEAGGITVGVLPDDHAQRASRFVDIPILTGMGSARNCVNILSSRVVVACAGGLGTLSEVALALKFNRPVILLGFDPGPLVESLAGSDLLFRAKTPEQAVEIISLILKGQ
ncbi:MAG: TIGR00725 family protein [Desulfatibacillaceae bacterium]|nr:TIGR00725 family protein [Desulfatibacillaceae bacterium]